MSIDWGRLFNEGRCKNYGVPWSDEEAHARSIGVPAEYVRRGCLTVEAAEKMKSADLGEQKKTGKIPLAQLKKEDLLSLCADNGIAVTDAATKSVLIEELNAKGIKSVLLEE